LRIQREAGETLASLMFFKVRFSEAWVARYADPKRNIKDRQE
jgi:hypothetical protein